ncbi:MAG TPA: MFS transporter [Phycisphaerales bacterium]|nr:MFS transporter [Phycisphaerales bacterium]
MPPPSEAPPERAPTPARAANTDNASPPQAAPADGPNPAETRADSGGRWGVLSHKHYRNVLGAQVFSNIGTWTEMFAIQMFVARATGKLDDQGTLGACQLLPIFVLGVFGGLASDRMNRRTLLVATQVLLGLVAIGVALVIQANFANPRTAIHWLFFFGVLNGCVMAFNFPAWQVLTPRLVPREDLNKAITLNGIQFNTARVIGPAIAGLVLAKWGAPPLLWFNAATFILMAGVVMMTPDDPAPRQYLGRMMSGIREAWSFLMHQRGPRAVFMAQFALCLLAAPMVRMLSNFVIAVYGLEEHQIAAARASVKGTVSEETARFLAAEAVGGTLLAIQGVGAVVGGLAIRYVPKWYPKHHFIPLSVAGLGLSITAFALAREVWVGYLAMAVCGWFWMWAFNQSWAALQVLTPDRLRGWVMSVANVAVFGAMAAGAIIAGFGGEQLKVHKILDEVWATQASILMLSVPLALVGVWMMLYRVPEVDGLPPGGDRKVARSLVHAITASEHRPERDERDGRAGIGPVQEPEPM